MRPMEKGMAMASLVTRSPATKMVEVAKPGYASSSSSEKICGSASVWWLARRVVRGRGRGRGRLRFRFGVRLRLRLRLRVTWWLARARVRVRVRARARVRITWWLAMRMRARAKARARARAYPTLTPSTYLVVGEQDDYDGDSYYG